MDQEVL